jgi:hypothetical protein
LDRGISACAHQHVNVVLHRLDVDLHTVEILLRLPARRRKAQREENWE